MKLHSESFANGDPIPVEFAFCKIGNPVTMSDNRNPHLAWSEVPEGTRSFVLTCVDPDVPSKPDDVNQEGREVPADLPRVEFVHWTMADIPADCRELAAGSCCDGITAHGKQAPDGPDGSKQGLNDYTGWFAGDADMGGNYSGYDGPCPPWNDSLLHHYHFRIHALDVASLGLTPPFTLTELRQAMDGHVMAEAEWMGTYTLNPRLTG
jgi:Raf kinase inhibitor-like YbhB/YbcL family protein